MKSKVSGASVTRARSRSSGHLARRTNPSAELGAGPLAGPWSVTMTEPITSVAVHAYYGHLLIELRSNEECVRMQLMRRDLSDVLTAFVDVVGRLAEFAE